MSYTVFHDAKQDLQMASVELLIDDKESDAGRKNARRWSMPRARLFCKPISSIPKGEMESGIFHDIEQAIARPGEEIGRTFGVYTTHRDYSTSARLNKFVKSGKTRFYVEYLGETYELTIIYP